MYICTCILRVYFYAVYLCSGVKWDKLFKNGPSKICGRQPLKTFTWFILEYFAPKHCLKRVSFRMSSSAFRLVALF